MKPCGHSRKANTEVSFPDCDREAYFSADEHEAVLAMECATADEARTQLAGLPLVQAGLIDLRIIPLVPYSGFARLSAR